MSNVELYNLLKRWISKRPPYIYNRLLALRNFVVFIQELLVIYQMGKVGSSTVHKTLKEEGVNNVKAHFLSRGGWERSNKIRWSDPFSEEQLKGARHSHYYLGRLLRWWIHTLERRRVRVVTLVRDPIARKVSEAFQVGPPKGVPQDTVNKATDMLEDILMSQGVLEYAYTWFEREIEQVFGVNVLNCSFNREVGYGRITRSHVDILILKLERLDELIPTVLAEFVERPLQLQEKRTRTDAVYAQTVDRLSLPEGRVRRLYDHKWMRHFYTENEIERFVNRWSARAEGSSSNC